MPLHHDPASFDARIEELTRALEASSDVHARTAARELVTLILDFHGTGLRQLLELLYDAPVSVRRRMAGDPVIGALLALHDLEPGGLADGRTPPPGEHSSPLHFRRPVDGSATASNVLHAVPAGRCDLCAAELPEAHHHFVDVVSRQLSCSCRACWLLSGAREPRDSRRAVPDRFLTGPAFRLTDAQWEALQLPVATAFFMFNSAIGRQIAFYPSPAGATESALPLTAWRDVEQANPWVCTAAPDTEAVLVRKSPREGDSYEAFVVPIDACYDLVGRIRLRWSGFDGGDEVRAEIDRFFQQVAARSHTAASAAGL